MPDKVCIFWDNSNIFIPAQFIANRREGGSAEREIRIHFENLFKLAKFGRDVSLAVCVGSVPPDLHQVWDHLRNAGVDVELYERGAETHQEQGLDQCLQVYMLRALADVRPAGVAVLLTGDGKGYESGRRISRRLGAPLQCRMGNRGDFLGFSLQQEVERLGF